MTKETDLSAVITFFPVGNGDMALIQLESGRTILVDINIRQPDDEIRDVAADLRERLARNDEGRPYVDAMLLTHPDQDHCRGLVEHFHLGPTAEYEEPEEDEAGKIIIREMWSSPMVFRRSKRKEEKNKSDLCEDAKAWAKEARRRVKLVKDGKTADSGDRIQVLGEDEDGKTDNLEDVLIKAGETIVMVDGAKDGTFEAYLIAPAAKGSDEEEEERSKNDSSVILRFSIVCDDEPSACKLLLGGDAGVAIWEKVWKEYKRTPGLLAYDLMVAPHHCSWRSLSHESWSDTKGKAKPAQDALDALGQARDGARIVSSSKEISSEDADPPCDGAKREYEKILDNAEGKFLNTATHKDDGDVVPMVFEVQEDGPVLRKAGTSVGVKKRASLKASFLIARGREEAARQPVQKDGGKRYA